MVQPPSSNSLNLVSALNDGLQCSLEEVYIKNSWAILTLMQIRTFNSTQTNITHLFNLY